MDYKTNAFPAEKSAVEISTLQNEVEKLDKTYAWLLALNESLLLKLQPFLLQEKPVEKGQATLESTYETSPLCDGLKQRRQSIESVLSVIEKTISRINV